MRYKVRIEISQEIELCLETPLFTGDVGNTVELSFYLRGKDYEFTTASLFGTNKAGETVFTTAQAEGNTVVLPIVNEMFQVPPKADMQVVLYDGAGNALTSGFLHFTVIQGLSENASVEGTDEYNSLMELLAQVSGSMAQINRAEQAANELEAFLQLIAQPEQSIVHQITESEADSFTQGFAIVSASVTTDSDGGPILTEYKYPLIAESFDTFGSVTVNQLRLYNGSLQRRTAGGEWTEVSGSSAAETDSLTYQGSLGNTDSLPENPATGDMYNIETESTISVKGTEYVTRCLISCSGTIDSLNEFYSTYNADYDSWLDNPSELELFDSNGNRLSVGAVAMCFDGTVLVQGTGLEEGTEIRYIQLPDQDNNESAVGDIVLNVYETIALPVMPKQKVFYNGNEWDVFANMGDIEAALTHIEALQNSYISDDAV